MHGSYYEHVQHHQPAEKGRSVAVSWIREQWKVVMVMGKNIVSKNFGGVVALGGRGIGLIWSLRDLKFVSEKFKNSRSTLAFPRISYCFNLVLSSDIQVRIKK